MKNTLLLLAMFMTGISCGRSLSHRQEPRAEAQDKEAASSHSRMANALCSRLFAPADDWLASPGMAPLNRTREQWYALVIRPENPVRCPVIAIRFRLDWLAEGIKEHEWSEKEPWWAVEESPKHYMARKLPDVRAALWERMELAFALEHPDGMETFTYGVGYLYLLPTQESSVDKLPKDALIAKGR